MTIKGIYRDGKVELAEKPALPDGAEVTVTFETPLPKTDKPRYIYFGMFAGPPEKMSREDDFKAARRSIWGKLDGQ